MKVQIQIILLLCFVLVKGQAQAQNSNQMQEAQVERLITALETKDYDQSFQIIEALRNDGIKIQGELVYYEALSALAIGNPDVAYRQSETYLKEGGQEALFYSQAQEIYAAAAENLDAQNLLNSYLFFNKANLKKLIENRRSSSYEALFKEQQDRYTIWNSNYVNNDNGTISTFSVNQKNDGTYNLIRLDWLACPIGTRYNATDQSCIGVPNKILSRDASKFINDYSFLGFKDWNLPQQLHMNFDQSHQNKEGPESIMQSWNTGNTKSRSALFKQEYSIPHHYILSTPSNPSHGYNSLHLREDNKLPCLLSKSLNCGSNDGGGDLAGTVIPVRGPFIVKQSTNVNCFETNLASRGQNITYGSRQLSESKTLCEFEDDKGKLYFLNDHYQATVFDPFLNTLETITNNSAVIPGSVQNNHQTQIALDEENVAAIMPNATFSEYVSSALPGWAVPQVGHYGWLSPPPSSALANPKTASDLKRLQAILNSDVKSQLKPITRVDCDFNEDIKSYLLFQNSAIEQAQKRLLQRSLGQVYEDGPAEIILAQGNCVNGELVGPFIAHYRYAERLSFDSYITDFDVYGKVEGQFENGKLKGELQRLWVQESKPGSMEDTMVNAAISHFENGVRKDGEVILVALVKLQSTRTIISSARPDRRESVDIWLNGDNQISTLMLNGVNDGYTRFHDPVLENLKQCFRQGSLQLDSSYCDGIN